MVEPRYIAEILGLGKGVRTVDQLETAVSAGLPKQSLEKLSSRLHADSRVAKLYKFQIVPPATWKRRNKLLSTAESEKTERLARVLAAAEYVWADQSEASKWMHAPHPELHLKTPLQTAQTELGARRVETLLEKLFYGIPA